MRLQEALQHVLHALFLWIECEILSNSDMAGSQAIMLTSMQCAACTTTEGFISRVLNLLLLKLFDPTMSEHPPALLLQINSLCTTLARPRTPHDPQIEMGPTTGSVWNPIDEGKGVAAEGRLGFLLLAGLERLYKAE